MLTLDKLRRLLTGELDGGAQVGMKEFLHTVPASMVALEDLRMVEPMMKRLSARAQQAAPADRGGARESRGKENEPGPPVGRAAGRGSGASDAGQPGQGPAPAAAGARAGQGTRAHADAPGQDRPALLQRAQAPGAPVPGPHHAPEPGLQDRERRTLPAFSQDGVLGRAGTAGQRWRGRVLRPRADHDRCPVVARRSGAEGQAGGSRPRADACRAAKPAGATARGRLPRAHARQEDSRVRGGLPQRSLGPGGGRIAIACRWHQRCRRLPGAGRRPALERAGQAGAAQPRAPGADWCPICWSSCARACS